MRIALVTSSVVLAVGFVTTGCSKKAVGAPGEIFAVQVIAVEAKRQPVTESLSLIGSPGQVIARDAVLSWLVDLDPIKVELNVPERFLSQLQVGQTLDLKVAAYPTNRFQGKVYFVAPSVDSNTRTTLVKAEIPNPKRELKPGMFANLDLTVNVR